MSFGDWVDAEAWSLDSDPWGPLAETHTAGVSLGVGATPMAAIAEAPTVAVTLDLAASPAIVSNVSIPISFSLDHAEATSTAVAEVNTEQIAVAVGQVPDPRLWEPLDDESDATWVEDAAEAADAWVKDGSASGTWS